MTEESRKRSAVLRDQGEAIAMKLEVVVVPVSDVDRAKGFYQRLGWRLDADIVEGEVRLVQLTPPGAACSVQFGSHVTTAASGSAQALYLVVADVEAARQDLVERGVEVSAVYHCQTRFACRFDRWAERRSAGLAPSGGSYGSFASFADPDGNGWLLQEVTTRFPGRIDPTTVSFNSPAELAGALKRARAAHGAHERDLDGAAGEWPEWYAAFIVAEQSGANPPS
jgi:catechol 2,3-dioxygenase-like lactoylglutathione lyase family enzyme